MNMKPSRETWGTQLGVILAVMGSAVGLGNFLRFPGLAAQYGGVFMIPYITAFLLLGLPLAWSEWAMGRYGGTLGYNSAAGIYRKIWPNRFSPYMGVLAMLIPVIIYMYYVYIEGWCLAYAMRYLCGAMDFGNSPEAYGSFFGNFVAGDAASGVADMDLMIEGKPTKPTILNSAAFFLLICFVLNFTLIYRGLTKGIEWFCKWAMPALILCAVIIMIRVLTLGAPIADKPEQTVANGLGYMWNPVQEHIEVPPPAPQPVAEDNENASPATEGDDEDTAMTPPAAADTSDADGDVASDRPQSEPATAPGQIGPPTFFGSLLNGKMWLEAAGQIFFSLSVGFGIIITYASYTKRDDDIALASLTAASGNGFCEVVLGGLMTIPAAFVFMGPAFMQRVQAGDEGTFDLGFQTLPNVFNQMSLPGMEWTGPAFGFLFFFLLFLAAVTSSLSMLQPAIALLEEGLGLNRKASVAMLGFITACGATFVVVNAGGKAIDTLDFWVGTVGIYVLATFQVILFAWVLGMRKGMEELERGAEIRVPRLIGFIIKYVSPAYLLIIFAVFAWQNFVTPLLPGTPAEVFESSTLNQILTDGTVQASLGLILAVALLFGLLIAQSVKRWQKLEAEAEAADR